MGRDYLKAFLSLSCASCWHLCEYDVWPFFKILLNTVFQRQVCLLVICLLTSINWLCCTACLLFCEGWILTWEDNLQEGDLFLKRGKAVYSEISISFLFTIAEIWQLFKAVALFHSESQFHSSNLSLLSIIVAGKLEFIRKYNADPGFSQFPVCLHC